MANKKIVITGIVMAGVVLAGVVCFNMTRGEKAVPATEVQADEPETGTEPEKEEIETEEPEVVEVAEEAEKSEEDTLTDLYAGAVVETETAEEEEYIQSLSEGEAEIINEEVEDMEPTTMYALQTVNLRSHTAVTSESLRLVNYAEQVTVTGITTNKQWYRVEDESKGVGFIASSYLSTTKPTQNTSTQQSSTSTDTTQQSTETTSQPSGDTTSTQQPSGGSSSVPGISQADMDWLKSVTAGQQQGVPQETGGHPGVDAGGHYLNQ